ncbi:MAG: CpaF family protein [Deltaproteobacteria bacterium]|nr:CpaF family protein [Deltaproteobacteria bacterium]
MALRSFGRRPKGAEEEGVQGVAPAATPAAAASLRPQTSDAAIADIAARVHPVVAKALDMSQAMKLSPDDLAAQLQAFLETEEAGTQELTPLDRRRVVICLINDIKGLGPLEPLFHDPSVSDILVNGLKSVYVERRGKLEPVDIKFRDGQHLLRIAQRISGWVGRRIDEASPMVDLRLPDGSRVNIVIPPLAIDGATISIRRFLMTGVTLKDLAAQDMLSPAMARLLAICVKSRLNILISGGTGAGKTTLMNTLSREISHGERLVTIEDAAELQLQQPHVVRLETRTMSAEGTGEVSMRALLINALRMRPDRVIVGEVRGSEAMEMLQAMNTGHPGSMCTIHANTPRDALTRLENMLLMGAVEMPLTAIRQQVASSVDLVVQVARLRTGRRCLTSITDVAGMENDTVITEEMWRLAQGESSTAFEGSGRRPSWMEAVDRAGLRAELLEVLQMANDEAPVSAAGGAGR